MPAGEASASTSAKHRHVSDAGAGTARGLLCNAIAGASAGAIAATFVCPLDVIKTRFQVEGLTDLGGRKKGSIIVRSLDQIVKKEGFRGLYRGLTPTVLALLPNWAVYFTTYDRLKSLLAPSDGSQLPVLSHMLAASGAGAATAIATNPLWVVKTRFQIQGLRNEVVAFEGTFTTLKRIACKEGIRGLYSGLVPALAGVSHVAIQFPVYEKIKSYLADRAGTRVESLGAQDVAVASSLSKVVASTLTYPHEVVRSKLQDQNARLHYSGMVDCIKKIARKDGVPGFYKGCGTNLLRTTPAAVITFTSFEMIHRFLVSHFPLEPQPQMC